MSADNNSSHIFKCEQRFKSLQIFYQRKIFIDIELIAKNEHNKPECIEAHRLLLSAFSGYFLEKLTNDGHRAQVEIKGIDAKTLKSIIDFMYSGSIELSLQTIERLSKAALLLKIKVLVDGICEFIEKNIDFSNCFDWGEKAVKLGLPRLKMPDILTAIQITNFGYIKIYTYDSENRSWLFSKCGNYDEMFDKDNPAKRFSTVVIGDKLYGVEGQDETSKQVDVMDLQTWKWEHFAMRKGRKRCTLANLNENLCVFGGYNEENIFVDTIDIYNPSNCQWHVLQPPFPLTKTSQIATHNGILYILDFHSGRLQFYDIFSKEWTSKKIDTDNLHSFGFAATEECLYVFGGVREEKPQKTVKRYSLFNDYSELLEELPSNDLHDITATVWQNKILIFARKYENLNYIQEYDPIVNIWYDFANFSNDPKGTIDYIEKHAINTLITRVN